MSRWSTYPTASSGRISSRPIASSSRAIRGPVASWVRTWSTRIDTSSPGTISPSRRWDSISLCVMLRGTSLSADAGSIFLIQILEYILYRYHVTILGVYIVEVCPVGVGVAVADGFARYDRPEAILQSVYHRCPDAARGRG